MLHEILLSLSGIQSSLWSRAKGENADDGDGVKEQVTPAERAMLTELASLSHSHAEVKENCASVRATHSSPICRAVCSRILVKHLGTFRNKIIDFEAAILRTDADYVGAYQIVPLSTVVTQFRPWIRLMTWLQQTSQYILGLPSKGERQPCNGPQLMQYLHVESLTGFTEIKAATTDLLTVGQVIWMKDTASWILHGRRPLMGADDYMIQTSNVDEVQNAHVLNDELVPFFVSERCSADIVSIGNALIQMRRQVKNAKGSNGQDDVMSLLSSHAEHLRALHYPLNTVVLEIAIGKINHSISRSALSHLLPMLEIRKCLQVFRHYLLLGRGEFAIALINNTDAKFAAQSKSLTNLEPVRKVGKSDYGMVREADLDAILAKSWSDLAALQGVLESEDPAFLSARQMLKFTTFNATQMFQDTDLFSTVAPIPTVLRLVIPVDSPLSILLTGVDVARYAHTNAYLLSLRRAEMRLSDLWKLTGHRRCHPAPLGPPMSSTSYGRKALTARREREHARNLRTRCHWSSMSNGLFFLNEFGAYLHGEVINNSELQLQNWLGCTSSVDSADIDTTLQPSAETEPDVAGPHNRKSLRFDTDTDAKSAPRDPRTIANAHQVYLRDLSSALLIDQITFCQHLKTLLTLIDHFAALFQRLQTAWQGLDLQEDDGIMDAYVNYAQDEEDVLGEMKRSRQEFDTTLTQLVQDLKDIEKEREVGDVAGGMVMTRIASVDINGGFVSWKPKTLDRLIMKLDFLHGRDTKTDEDELVEHFVDAME